MKNFFVGLLDWIYKKKCYFCGKSKESVVMCSECYDSLDFLPASVNRDIRGSRVYCAGVYSKNLQKMIRGIKYHGQKDLAYYVSLALIRPDISKINSFYLKHFIESIYGRKELEKEHW